MIYLVSHFIQGKLTPSQSKRLGDIYCPSTGEKVGQVAMASALDVDAAVVSAKTAFGSWSRTTPTHRAQILFRYRQLLSQHRDALAELIAQEHGKTLADAHGSLQRGIEVLEVACSAPSLLKGDYAESTANQIDSYSLHQPLGVCAGITPFNFPAMIALWMFPLSIVCGNTFILKPSEKDPSCGLRLAELLQEAGLPDGVLNVIQGDKEAVDALITHPDVDAVSFVGSTPIAEYIYKTATSHGKRTQAMGGAKNHAVVMPDADLDQTADALIGAAYGSAGERCMAISVVVTVGENLADALVKKLIPRIQTLKIGHSLEKETQMGPLVTASHRDKVVSYIELGIKEGAQLVVDGRNYQHPVHKNGFYLGGCLFDHVTPTMRIYREEIFGPVLCVLRAPDFETAIRWVSEHEYGNGAAIFTKDGYTAREFASRVQIGMIGINVPIPVPAAFHSFGGWKHSSFGNTGMYGMEAIRFYTKLKTVTQRWPEGKQEGPDFNIPSTHASS